MFKVAVTDYGFENLDVEKNFLEPLGCSLVGHKKYQGEPALIELVSDADAVITQFAPVTAAVIHAMKKAKVIVRYGIGYDNVDCKAAAAKGIPVCNVPDFCIDEVADHTLAMILEVTRKIALSWNSIRRGEWKLPFPLEQMFALKNRTVGLVAYGKIAREVALRLKNFKCRIMVHDPFVEDAVIRRDGFLPAALEEIYAESDLLSLHCPSNAQTQYMINSDSIRKMKKGVILVNCSRGTLVKTPDLVEALQNGRISAAALDVTDPEPLPPDHPLLKMDNVVINGHCASGSVEAVQSLRISVAHTVACAVQNRKLPNIVNGIQPL